MELPMHDKTLPRVAPAGFGPRACLLAVASATLLAGCAHKPPYEPPAIVTPAAFKEGGNWKPADPNAAQVPDAWWTMFDDPVLTQLQERVVVDNQNLKASLAQYRIAQAALASSRSTLFPIVGATAGATRSANGSNLNSSANSSYSVTASASWEVDLWGRLSRAVDAAQAQLEASRDDLAAATLSVRATLTISYFSLRATEEQVALLERSLAAFQRSLDLTQNRYRAGVASAADVAQAQTQLKSTQAQLIEANTSRAQLEHAIAVLVGKAPADFALDKGSSLPRAPEVPLQLPSELLQRRPDIAAAERRVAAANSQIGVAQAAFFPSLTLSASAGLRGSSLSDLIDSPARVWSLGPQLAMALFDAGARRAAVDSARAAADLAAANYRQTVLTAFQEVEDNLVLGSNLRLEADVQREALDAAQRALEIVNNQYQSGTVSYLNVITAQTTALAAERTLLDVRSRRLAALAQLLKNIAGRWDLEPVATK